MDQTPTTKMHELLDHSHTWPEAYPFKFIVPLAQKAALLALLPNATISEKPSSKGAYVSITARIMMPSAQAVMAVYEAVSVVPGLVSL